MGPNSIRQLLQYYAEDYRKTASTVWGDIPGSELVLTTTSSVLSIQSSGFYRSCEHGWGNVRLVVDGQPVIGGLINIYPQAPTGEGKCASDQISLSWVQPVSTGQHSVKLQWRVNPGSQPNAYIDNGFNDDGRKLGRQLVVTELIPMIRSQ